MPVPRNVFESDGIDWRQRVLWVLNRDRSQAWPEEELLSEVRPRPSMKVLQETLQGLVDDGFVVRNVHNGITYYYRYLRGY